MLKKIINKNKEQKGFTLIELLAVIVILGIIAAIAVPAVAGVISDSKQDAHEANIELFISAARIAVASGEELETVEGESTKGFTLKSLKDNGYLESIPVNPTTGSEYADTEYVEINGNAFSTSLDSTITN